MAHEMALAIQGTKLIHDMELVSDMAWKYADAMQAEADKRVVKLPDVFFDDKPSEEWYPEYEIGRNYPPDAYVMYNGEKTLAVSINEEWQPDWSQAPSWAVAWAMDMSGECYWHSGSKEPKVDNHIFESSADGHTFEAPSFGYKGNWQDSLRKRPNT